MSSISPMATKTFAQKIHALGADYIDAPVSGDADDLGWLAAMQATSGSSHKCLIVKPSAREDNPMTATALHDLARRRGWRCMHVNSTDEQSLIRSSLTARRRE